MIEPSSITTLTGSGIRKRTILNVSTEMLEMSLSDGEILSSNSKRKTAEPESPKKVTAMSAKASTRGLNCKNHYNCIDVYTYLNVILVRRKTHDVLPLLSEDTHQDLRTYIIPTVLHKVSQIA